MKGKRQRHSASFKAQVALAALKGDRTINELAAHFGVHPTNIHAWRKQLLASAEGIFANGAKPGSAKEKRFQEPPGAERGTTGGRERSESSFQTPRFPVVQGRLRGVALGKPVSRFSSTREPGTIQGEESKQRPSPPTGVIHAHDCAR